MPQKGWLILSLALAGCAPVHAGCHLGTHHAQLASGLWLGPAPSSAVDKLRDGEPLVCAVTVPIN